MESFGIKSCKPRWFTISSTVHSSTVISFGIAFSNTTWKFLELNAVNHDGFQSAFLYIVLNYMPWYYVLYTTWKVFGIKSFTQKRFQISAVVNSFKVISPGIAFSITTWKGFGIKSCIP